LTGVDAVVTDPPFNMDYHYESYDDDLDEDKYYEWLAEVLQNGFVVVHYPESIFRLAYQRGIFPSKCAAWTYNANTHRQWRMAAWFGIEPDFTLIGQEYKNQSDARIQERIARGETARLYDWWFAQQVKNVSEDKTEHPCQMPVEIMRNIVGVTPSQTVCDPFMGSGTTGVACIRTGRRFIGVEIEPKYCAIAVERMERELSQPCLPTMEPERAKQEVLI
jgi:DNA modification methylase